MSEEYNKFKKNVETLVQQNKARYTISKRQSKSLTEIFLHALQTKVNNDFTVNNYKSLINEFQNIFNTEINANKNYDLNINMNHRILVHTKKEWPQSLETINLDELYKEIKILHNASKNSKSIYCGYYTWYGTIHDNDDEIPKHWGLNKKYLVWHARMMIYIMVGGYVMWLGYDPSGFRPGNETKRKNGRTDAFFAAFIVNRIKDSKKRNHPIFKGFSYNYTWCEVCSEKQNYFNPCISYGQGKNKLWCCDVSAIISGLITLLSIINNYEKLIQIVQNFFDIKNEYYSDIKNGAKRLFVKKRKAILDKKIRIPIKNIIEPNIQQLSSLIYSDCIIEHQVRNNTKNFSKNKIIIQMAKNHSSPPSESASIDSEADEKDEDDDDNDNDENQDEDQDENKLSDEIKKKLKPKRRNEPMRYLRAEMLYTLKLSNKYWSKFKNDLKLSMTRKQVDDVNQCIDMVLQDDHANIVTLYRRILMTQIAEQIKNKWIPRFNYIRNELVKLYPQNSIWKRQQGLWMTGGCGTKRGLQLIISNKVNYNSKKKRQKLR